MTCIVLHSRFTISLSALSLSTYWLSYLKLQKCDNWFFIPNHCFFLLSIFFLITVPSTLFHDQNHLFLLLTSCIVINCIICWWYYSLQASFSFCWPCWLPSWYKHHPQLVRKQPSLCQCFQDKGHGYFHQKEPILWHATLPWQPSYWKGVLSKISWDFDLWQPLLVSLHRPYM